MSLSSRNRYSEKGGLPTIFQLCTSDANTIAENHLEVRFFDALTYKRLTLTGNSYGVNTGFSRKQYSGIRQTLARNLTLSENDCQYSNFRNLKIIYIFWQLLRVWNFRLLHSLKWDNSSTHKNITRRKEWNYTCVIYWASTNF